MKAPVIYRARFVYEPTPNFKLLWNALPWEHRDGAPRRECWFNSYGQPYTYGTGEYARTYVAHDLSPTAEKSGWLVWEVLNRLNGMFDDNFDCCFVNGYEHGRQHLGWHSDDSPEMDMDHPIAVVSLGAEREIWFRERPNMLSGDGLDDIHKMPLANGSVLLMKAGMQRDWQHRIPKSPRGEDCPPRLSLTFRRLVR